jgi:competence protein ComGC
MTILEFLHGLPEMIVVAIAISILLIVFTACFAIAIKLTSDN